MMSSRLRSETRRVREDTHLYRVGEVVVPFWFTLRLEVLITETSTRRTITGIPVLKVTRREMS